MAKEVNKRINIWLNQNGIQNNLKSIKAEITKTANELNKLPIGSEEWVQKSQKLKQLKGIYANARKEISAAGKAMEKNVITAGSLSAAYLAASAALSRFNAATQEYVDAYAAMDDAMSAVQKTTGMTRDQVESLRTSLQGLGTRTSTEELLKIAEIGGRMGIAQDQIEGFTEAVNKANVALGDSFSGGAEEISSVLGKIALAYKETRAQDIGTSLTQIGSALNEVGASANATESNIAAFVQRVGSMPEVFRPTVQQAVALGAAFEESSIQAEVASRAFGIVMTKAATDVEGFAAAMGRPAEEIENLINTNPAQFFVEFAASLQGLNGTQVGATLKELGLSADGVNKIIGAMSANTERFTEILNTSNTAFEEAISLDREYAVVNENSAAQLEKAKNAVMDAKAALGEELIPVVTKLTQAGASGIRLISEVVKWMKEHKGLIVGLSAAYGLLYAAHMKEIAAKKLSTTWTKLEAAGEAAGTTVTSLFALAKAKMAKNTLAAAAAQKALKAAFAATPWGAIITAVTTIGTAFALLRDRTKETTEAQQDLEVQIEQQYNTERKKVEELYSILEDENASREKKMRAINQLKSTIPGYVATLDKEGKVVNNNRKAIDQYLVSLKNKIRYQNLEKGLNEVENKIIEAELKSRNARNAYFSQSSGQAAWDKTRTFLFGGTSKEQAMDNADATLNGLYALRREYNNRMKEMDDELVKQTGQTYNELYGGYNENLLTDLTVGGSGSGSSSTNDKVDEKIKELEKYGRAIEDFGKKLSSWGRESMSSSGNEALDAILGTEQKWAARFAEAQEQMEDLLELRRQLVADGEDTSAVDALISKLQTGMANMADLEAADIQKVTEKYHKDIDTFIKSEEKSMAESVMSETEKQKAAIEEKYNLEIERIEQLITARIAAYGEDDPELKNLREKIALLKKMKDEALGTVGSGGGTTSTTSSETKSVWQQMAEFDWSTLSDNWQGALDLMTQGLNQFAGAATDIYGSIVQIQANATEAELQKTQEAYDAKSAALKRQLDNGIISQKAYDARMEKLEKDKEKRERTLKHEQFAREKRANIIQSIIAGALSATQTLSQWGIPWGLIPMGIALATAAVQTAAIASQPNPYYKGGYIDSTQYAVMGEQGPEWVASNPLLKDRRAAAIISALDDYQHGNPNALSGITFNAPNVSQPVSSNGGNFAAENGNGTEIVGLMRQIKTFLEDPNNRRAYISRKIQLEFDEQEEEVRSLARL